MVSGLWMLGLRACSVTVLAVKTQDSVLSTQYSVSAVMIHASRVIRFQNQWWAGATYRAQERPQAGRSSAVSLGSRESGTSTAVLLTVTLVTALSSVGPTLNRSQARPSREARGSVRRNHNTQRHPFLELRRSRKPRERRYATASGFEARSRVHNIFTPNPHSKSKSGSVSRVRHHPFTPVSREPWVASREPWV